MLQHPGFLFVPCLPLSRSLPRLVQCMAASNASQAEPRQWGPSVCHLMDIRANLASRSGGRCGNKDKLTFLLCDLEENGRQPSQRRQAMSSVKGKRISI